MYSKIPHLHFSEEVIEKNESWREIAVEPRVSTAGGNFLQYFIREVFWLFKINKVRLNEAKISVLKYWWMLPLW